MDGTDQQPRWLDDQEMSSWRALSELLIRLPDALDDQLQRDAGVSHFEYQVMAGLSDAPDRTLRMSVLAEFANGSLSRLSRVVDRLVRRGWVSRHPDPEDGRYTLATLTDDGVAKMIDAAPGHVAEVRRLVFDTLTKTQVKQLREIGTRMLRAVDPGECPRTGPSPS